MNVIYFQEFLILSLSLILHTESPDRHHNPISNSTKKASILWINATLRYEMEFFLYSHKNRSTPGYFSPKLLMTKP